MRLRVYERGAGETRSCGTGACAAVAIGRRRGLLGPEVRVGVRGGELRVNWAGAGSTHLAERAGREYPSKVTLRSRSYDDTRSSRTCGGGSRGGDASPATCSAIPNSSSATRRCWRG